MADAFSSLAVFITPSIVMTDSKDVYNVYVCMYMGVHIHLRSEAREGH